LRYTDTTALREKLIEMHTSGTVNRYLSTLRGVLKQAYLLDQMSEDDFRRATKLKRLEDEPIPEGDGLTHEEIGALLQACDDGTNAGARDAAIIALLYAAGLKPTELTGLEMSNYNNGDLVIKNRDEQRTINIDNGALEALQGWLAVRGKGPGHLFFAIDKADRIQSGKRIFSQALCVMLIKRAKIAGIRRVSPRDFRHSFIIHLLGAGVDIFLVSRLAGIKDLRTIVRYDRRGDDALREAVKLLRVPYKRRG